MDGSDLLIQKGLFAQSPSLTKQTSDGICLTGQIRPKQKVGVFGKLISVIFLFLFLFIFWWFFLIVGIIGSIIAWSIPSIRHHILAHFRLLPGELLLPCHPLKLGEESRLKFRRCFKNKAKTSAKGILILKIYCVERVQYTKGTDTETELKIIWQSQPIKSMVSVGSDTLILSTDFTIPKDIPPSFESKNNQIRWVASVEQTIPKLANHVYSNFTFIVDPVVIA